MELFVGNEVINKRSFYDVARMHDHVIGCEMMDDYYIDKNLVLLFKDKEGNFKYYNNLFKCNVIDDVSDLEYLLSTVYCTNCKFYPECNEKGYSDTEIIGVTNIKKVKEVENNLDAFDYLMFIKQYNSDIKHEDRFENIGLDLTDKDKKNIIRKRIVNGEKIYR